MARDSWEGLNRRSIALLPKEFLLSLGWGVRTMILHPGGRGSRRACRTVWTTCLVVTSATGIRRFGLPDRLGGSLALPTARLLHQNHGSHPTLTHREENRPPTTTRTVQGA